MYGIVQAVLADYNSTVRQGQVVAKLDPSLYDAQLRAAQAALAQARADLVGVDAAVADAQTKFTRAEALSASQLIPQSDLDAARIALEETNAGRREGEASVVEATAPWLRRRSTLNTRSSAGPSTGLSSSETWTWDKPWQEVWSRWESDSLRSLCARAWPTVDGPSS